jgi:hypothetical protein
MQWLLVTDNWVHPSPRATALAEVRADPVAADRSDSATASLQGSRYSAPLPSN